MVGLLHNIYFYVGVTPVGSDCPFDSGGGSFVLQCGTCTVSFLLNDNKLLCAIYVVIENELECAVVEIVLARISEVDLNCESQESIFCNKKRLGLSCYFLGLMFVELELIEEE